MDTVLWQPDSQWIENTNMHQFMHLVNQRYGTRFSDYSALQRWSCQQVDQFWTLVAEYCGIQMQGDCRRVGGCV